ncbi:MAG: hypothetical protein ABID38_06815 [Candidatus Diapherotrites archaeon]
MKGRKRVKKDKATGRFVQTVEEKTLANIRKFAEDSNIPLTEIAKAEGVSLDTVLRHRGARITKIELLRIQFQVLKFLARPFVEEMAKNKQAVTVKDVSERIHAQHEEITPSRNVMPKVLEALAKEGVKFERPREYHQAAAKAAAREAEFAQTYAEFIKLKRKHPKMRDEELAEKLEIPMWKLRFAQTDTEIIRLRKEHPQMRDEELATHLKITMWQLRKRVTALKKAGRLPQERRGYKKS